MPELVAVLVACAVSYGCGVLTSLRIGVLSMIGLAAAVVIAGGGIVPALLVAVAPWTGGQLVRSRRQLVAELAERNRALEAEQEALAALAVQRERARIARELHDIVAHHLAVMVIQAAAGRLDAPDGAVRFAGIADAGREALTELDRLVELLKADAPRALDLETLVGQARAAGLRLDYRPLPGGVQLPPDVRDSAYRVVQEGLTNALKHAAGSEVVVRLGVDAHRLEVEVRDRGATTSSPLATSGAGLGLDGMRERVEALGGELEAGPLDAGGWRLRAQLPLGYLRGMTRSSPHGATTTAPRAG